jgi:hypothetical protein
MWKNLQALRRRWVATLIESLTPVLAVAILVIVVSTWKKRPEQDTHYHPFGIKTYSHAFRNW